MFTGLVFISFVVCLFAILYFVCTESVGEGRDFSGWIWQLCALAGSICVLMWTFLPVAFWPVLACVFYAGMFWWRAKWFLREPTRRLDKQTRKMLR